MRQYLLNMFNETEKHTDLFATLVNQITYKLFKWIPNMENTQCPLSAFSKSMYHKVFAPLYITVDSLHLNS